jgi:phosphatidate phosphatase APP1
MSNWLQFVSTAMNRLNTSWDSVKQRVAEQFGAEDPIRIMPYRGYGTPKQLYLKGRVLQDQGIKLREENASVWENLRNTYRRFESDEIPQARLHVQFQEQHHEVISDKEGFFEVKITLPEELDGDRLWQKVSLELVEPKSEDSGPIRAEGEIIIVSDTAQFGVISDIDDTVIKTAATDLLKMIRIAYLGNEYTRRAFPGVPEFYNALQQGQAGNEGNPIFYVSSSAWNMYDLFVKFMDWNHVPAGPILLRDIELSPANLLAFEHQSHKMEQIKPILQEYPHLPFILIGDSGQKDAEIYQQLVHDYPNRILGIYLRDVTPKSDKRKTELAAIAEDVRQANCEFVVFSDTAVAAKHAVQKGWIADKNISAFK